MTMKTPTLSIRKIVGALAIIAALAPTARAQLFASPLQRAVNDYVALVAELQKSGPLPSQEWGNYVRQNPIDEAWTVSSIPGVFSLRHVAPDQQQHPVEFADWIRKSGLFFEWRTITLFLPKGAGFITRSKAFAPNPGALIAYDRDKGQYLLGANALPYVQQLLTHMDTTGLPKVGDGKATFILLSSPSCPYSAKLDPVLVKSGLSFRVYPTFGINPEQDYPYVHKIFCAPDKVAMWRKVVSTKPLPAIPIGSNQCAPSVMPVYTLADLDLLFGQASPTPSFYFPDGTVLSGANQLEQVKAKSADMAQKGLYFQ